MPKIYHTFLTVKPILEEPYAGKPLVRVSFDLDWLTDGKDKLAE
jgi:hypothetical protein